MGNQRTDESNSRRWNTSQRWSVVCEILICVNGSLASGQRYHEFGIHLLPCPFQTSNGRRVQTRDDCHHRRVVLQDSTPLEIQPVSPHEPTYPSGKEKLTSATLMKCFTMIARFRESSLSRIESATQLAIYTPNELNTCKESKERCENSPCYWAE